MSQQKNQIYIGNLSFSTEENDLEQNFKKYGDIIEIKIPTDRETGRKRGFAFITFSSSSEANSALVMHDKELDGRKIRVNIAQGKKEFRNNFDNGSGKKKGY